MITCLCITPTGAYTYVYNPYNRFIIIIIIIIFFFLPRRWFGQKLRPFAFANTGHSAMEKKNRYEKRGGGTILKSGQG